MYNSYRGNDQTRAYGTIATWGIAKLGQDTIATGKMVKLGQTVQ